ncbi:DUF5333 domain-containing protein [Planktotalea sp.]|jgi:hypothetical protein|uniref:DUF5333 domain-containing protein n=1 Tax=Planktotalea sp. TaxID=2029877 RepID=UPI0025FBDEF0|nr:DUF5333 domain-containing protein [Planktotalea sp.]
MHLTCTFTASLFAMSLAFAAPLSAKGLQNETQINNGLLAVGIADEIRNRCDSISARTFRALGFLNSLKRDARSKGYSNDEINRYTKSKTEKTKMRKRGQVYLAQNGASTSDAASMCRLGRAEIKKRSQIGVLLRAR